MNNKIPLLLVIVVLVIGALFWFTRFGASEPNTSQQASNPREIVADSETVPDMTDEHYQDYSQEVFDQAVAKRRVYFFHAGWCPTCKVANEELLKDADKLPDDVVIFKTDYDTETALKKKYGVTYQHTFVQVDENGELVKIWNGGGTDQIISNLE